MEKIDIENIMSEIRENIKERGYCEKELKFADVEILSPDDMGSEFNIGIFKNDLHKTYQSRLINSYRDLTSSVPCLGPIVKFIKRVLRKLMCFYVEPIVEDQNKFNDNIVKNMSQVSTKFDNDAKTIEELQNRVEELEVTCRKLEQMVKDKVEG